MPNGEQGMRGRTERGARAEGGVERGVGDEGVC